MGRGHAARGVHANRGMSTAVLDLAGDLKGFQFFWLKYVTGFDHTRHCMACLQGVRSSRVTPRMRGGKVALVEAERFDFLYLCGVATTGYDDNLHVPMRLAPGSVAQVTTYTGLAISIRNVEVLPIQPLVAPHEWPRAFSRCRNFQFGAMSYGLPALR